MRYTANSTQSRSLTTLPPPTTASTAPGDDVPLAAADVEFIARWMDSAFRIPGVGIRFGLDSVIGLLPGVGDAATALASLYILAAANRYGLGRAAQLRMALNIAIDAVLGAVPVIGDLFDVYWKANLRNVALLRGHLAATPESASGAKLRRHDRIFVVAVVGVVGLLLAASAVAAFYLVVRVASSLKHLVQ